MKTITVTVSPDGTVKVEAAGFEGDTCLEATASIEAALGSVSDRKRKDEYTEAREHLYTGI